MRTYPLILMTLGCLLFASLPAGPPDEPKQAPSAGAAVADAGKATAPETPGGEDNRSEEHLRSRVDRFWKSKIGTKYDDCYTLLNKKSRDKQTLVNYIQRINTRTTGYRIDSVRPDPADPNHVKVLVICTIQAVGYKMDNTKQLQDWFYEDGDWFLEYYPKNPFEKSRKPKPDTTTDPAKAAAVGPGGTMDQGEIDPERKKRFQELLEQMRKSYANTKPSMNEAVTPRKRSDNAAAQPPVTGDAKAAPDGPAAPADSGKEGAPAKPAGETGSGTPPVPEKNAKPAETPAKQDPAKTGGDPK